MGAGAFDLPQQVTGEENGLPPVRQDADDLADLPHALGIQAVGGLVEDDQLGVVEHGGGQGEALLHAQRVGAEAVSGAVRQADQLQALFDARAAHPLHRSGDAEVVASAHVGVEVGRLQGGADAGAGGDQVPGLGGPEEPEAPAVGLMIPMSMPMVVVLPLPFGPRKPKTWPRSTAKESWSTASTDSPRRVP